MQDTEATLGDILAKGSSKSTSYEIVLGLTSVGVDLIKNNQFINTIKSLRDFTGFGLKDSKNIIQTVFNNVGNSPLNPNHEIYITLNAEKYAAFMARWWDFIPDHDGFYIISTGPYKFRPSSKTKVFLD